MENSQPHREMDPVEQERTIIAEQIEWIHREVYLCDRNETDFYVVSNGITIPLELQEQLLNDGESVEVLTRAFEYAKKEMPTNLFTREAATLVVDTLRPYEAHQYEEMRLMLERISELDPNRDDDEPE